MELKVFDRILNRTVQFFGKFDINLRFDSIGSDFSFDAYFNQNNEEHKLLFRPGRYNLARIGHNGELLITGFILSPNFSAQPTPTLSNFKGYSVPGVLEDSQIPMSAYPLQSDNLTLREISTKLLRPFQIRMDVDDSVSALMDQPYEKTTAEPTQSVKDYLCSLASQKNIIVSHTPKGHLHYTKAKADMLPIYKFSNDIPGTTFALSFNGQGMHSEITVIKQADKDGGNAGQSTVFNPYVPKDTTAFRPKVIIQTAGTDNDTLSAAKNALAEELKNIVLTINTDRIVINGKVITPNQVVSVICPECFIYKPTNFFIEAVSLSGDPQKITGVLTCVPVEVYNGQAPKNIFE